jgi:hypothetical protein
MGEDQSEEPQTCGDGVIPIGRRTLRPDDDAADRSNEGAERQTAEAASLLLRR